MKMVDRSRLRVESLSEANVTKTSDKSRANNGSRGSYDGYSNKVKSSFFKIQNVPLSIK